MQNGVTMANASSNETIDPTVSSIVIESGYQPSEHEPFMNERQREYFRKKLLGWKDDILRESRETLRQSPGREPEPLGSGRSGLFGDRSGHRAAGPGPPAQADRQDRRRARPARGRLLRLLRGDRRADLPEAPGGPADRHAVGGGPGAPRAPRAGLSRRLMPAASARLTFRAPAPAGRRLRLGRAARRRSAGERRCAAPAGRCGDRAEPSQLGELTARTSGPGLRRGGDGRTAEAGEEGGEG